LAVTAGNVILAASDARLTSGIFILYVVFPLPLITLPEIFSTGVLALTSAFFNLMRLNFEASFWAI